MLDVLDLKNQRLTWNTGRQIIHTNVVWNIVEYCGIRGALKIYIPEYYCTSKPAELVNVTDAVTYAVTFCDSFCDSDDSVIRLQFWHTRSKNWQLGLPSRRCPAARLKAWASGATASEIPMKPDMEPDGEKPPAWRQVRTSSWKLQTFRHLDFQSGHNGDTMRPAVW